MRGIQFLTDRQGQKTSALVDLQEHREFWQDVLEEVGESTDFQFLIDGQGRKIAVLLDFSKHGELWEDIYDAIITDFREDEETVSWEEVKRELKTKDKLSV